MVVVVVGSTGFDIREEVGKMDTFRIVALVVDGGLRELNSSQVRLVSRIT